MSTAQRNAIANPAEGLTIYNTSVKCLQWWVGNVWHDGCGDNIYLEYPEGTVFCASGPTEIVEVTNPTTGRIWMDRNLGANQVATSSTDAAAYGDLYQWGRAADGHQCRNSLTTATNATKAVPNAGNPWDGLFITGSSDWLTPQDNNLWQGVNGTNNPCPEGFRLPTETEWDTERSSWSSLDAAGAFASPLKLLVAGFRHRGDGSLYNVGSFGVYWPSTVSGANAMRLLFGSSVANMDPDDRADGFSVRCLKG